MHACMYIHNNDFNAHARYVDGFAQPLQTCMENTGTHTYIWFQWTDIILFICYTHACNTGTHACIWFQYTDISSTIHTHAALACTHIYGFSSQVYDCLLIHMNTGMHVYGCTCRCSHCTHTCMCICAHV